MARRKKSRDFFNVLVKEGKLLISGLDGNYNAYRIFEYRGKKFKLTLVKVK